MKKLPAKQFSRTRAAAKQSRPRRASRPRRPIHKKVLLHPITLFGLLCAGVILAHTTWHSLAATYSVKAKVAAPPLTQPAVITSPADGSTVTSIPITVSGTCPADSYVKLLRNNSFSGVATCDNGIFSITTDLFSGANQLVAQDYNITDDAGPTSPAILVRYAPPSGGSGGSPSSPLSSDLLLKADFHYQVFQVGEAFRWGVSLSGGTAPYLLLISWGDGHTSNDTISGAQIFTISHTYSSVGHHVISLSARDTRGAKASLQLLALIEDLAWPVSANAGQCPSGGSQSRSSSLSHAPLSCPNLAPNNPESSKPWLWLTWSAYLTIVLMAISFWLGEREESRRLGTGPRQGVASRHA